MTGPLAGPPGAQSVRAWLYSAGRHVAMVGKDTTSPADEKECLMPVTTIDDRPVHVDAEGFLTEYTEWDEDLARTLAAQVGTTLTDEHWKALRFLRQDFATQGETATLRRVSALAGIPIKTLFTLFPQKPAKKMAYIAGLPKPRGCV